MMVPSHALAASGFGGVCIGFLLNKIRLAHHGVLKLLYVLPQDRILLEANHGHSMEIVAAFSDGRSAAEHFIALPHTLL